jgi:hypothetical protein
MIGRFKGFIRLSTQSLKNSLRKPLQFFMVY